MHPLQDSKSHRPFWELRLRTTTPGKTNYSRRRSSPFLHHARAKGGCNPPALCVAARLMARHSNRVRIPTKPSSACQKKNFGARRKTASAVLGQPIGRIAANERLLQALDCIKCRRVVAGTVDASFYLEELIPRPARIAAGKFALGERFLGTFHYIIDLLRKRLHFGECGEQRFFGIVGRWVIVTLREMLRSKRTPAFITTQSYLARAKA